MINETGNYPGAAWLWFYTFWYQVPAYASSPNADVLVIAYPGYPRHRADLHGHRRSGDRRAGLGMPLTLGGLYWCGRALAQSRHGARRRRAPRLRVPRGLTKAKTRSPGMCRLCGPSLRQRVRGSHGGLGLGSRRQAVHTVPAAQGKVADPLQACQARRSTRRRLGLATWDASSGSAAVMPEQRA